ncbi:MAG TPA: Flp family type IVb pilin, partial [Gaiellaceae bacterium]|nr:Flp family type IVb pilin [Gaiellaceae bacterium]
LRNKLSIGIAFALQGISLDSVKREEGQTLAEYALILALIAVAVVAAVVLLGGKISGLFDSVGSSI